MSITRKKPILSRMLTAALIAWLSSSPAWANDSKPGFSGYIQPVVGIIHSKSLNRVNDDQKRIDSLDQEAESETEFAPMLFWNLEYTLENGTTQFYAGTPENNIIDGSFLAEIGICQAFSNGTVLGLAYIPNVPVMDDEVWSDPFLLGKDRKETDRDSHAFSLSAESILGTPLTLKYGFATQDIDNEASGRYLVNQPGFPLLTPQTLESLKRSGHFHQFKALYAFDLGKGIYLEPGIAYMRGDADGDANTFDKIGGQVSLVYPTGQWEFFATLSVHYAEYDLTHPVFDKTRNQTEYDIFSGLSYAAPFGWESIMINLYAGFSQKDANIGFYDSTDLVGGLGLTWTF